MKFTFDFGAEIDVLTKGELDDSLSRVEKVWRAYAEGLKYLRRVGVLYATTGTPGVASGVLGGPREGYAWMLTSATLYASEAATVTVALGETGNWAVATPEVLTAAGPAVFLWSSRQLILRPGDVVWAGASAGTLSKFMLAGVEVPAEMLFKLVGG